MFSNDYMMLVFVIVAILMSLFLSVTFVGYFQDKREVEKVPAFISGLMIFSATLAIGVLPSDIASLTLPAGDSYIEGIRTTYSMLFVLYLVLIFLSTPFAFYFYKKGGPEVTTWRRVKSACKAVTVFASALAMLFVFGAIVYIADTDGRNKSVQRWIQVFSGNQTIAEDMAYVPISILTTVGFPVYVFYTGLGLVLLPMYVFKFHHSEYNLPSSSRGPSRRSSLLENYARGGDRASLLGTERQQQQRCSCCHACFRSRWVRYPLGMLLLLFSLLIVVSIVVTLIDKAGHGALSTGYVLEYRSDLAVMNPADQMLQALAPYGADLLVLYLIGIYIMLCTVRGISYFGVRLFWVKLFNLLPHRSSTEAVLLASVNLMFTVLVFLVSINFIAPWYIQFGIETYKSGPTPCSLGTEDVSCRITAIANIYLSIFSFLPAFGALFYYFHAAFIIMFLLGLVASCYFKKFGMSKDSGDDEEDD